MIFIRKARVFQFFFHTLYLIKYGNLMPWNMYTKKLDQGNKNYFELLYRFSFWEKGLYVTSKLESS